MAIARQVAEAYFAAAHDRGDLEDALRQLRHDVEFASPAAQIRGRDELRPYLEEFARAFPDAGTHALAHAQGFAFVALTNSGRGSSAKSRSSEPMPRGRRPGWSAPRVG